MNVLSASPSDLDASGQPARRIALVDDVSIIRAVFRSIAEDSPGIDLAWMASNLKEARAALGGELPDLLILDVNLPDGDGFEFATELTGMYPHLPILIFSAHEGSPYVQKAAQCGARGFIGKNVSPAKFVEAVEIVCSGGTCLQSF